MNLMTRVHNKEEILHILDKSYRFALVHPITRARKEFDRLKENQKVLIDFDFTPASFFSLIFFSKLSLYSSYHPEIYVVFRRNQKISRYEKNDATLFLYDLGIESDHIEKAYYHTKNQLADLFDFAKKENIHYFISNETNDDFIDSYRYRFLAQGFIQGTLPKEWVEEDEYSAVQIRPFRYVKNKDILRFLDTIGRTYKIFPNYHLENQTIQLLDRLDKTYSPFTKQNILKSRRNVYPEKIIGYEKEGKEVSFLDNYAKAGREKDKKILDAKLEEKALTKAEKEHRPLKVDDSFKNC